MFVSLSKRTEVLCETTIISYAAYKSNVLLFLTCVQNDVCNSRMQVV